MQRVIIKNLINDTLTNIELRHDGEGNGDYTAIIKELKSKESKEIALYTLRINKECNLNLMYTYNNVTNTVVVHDKLNRNDLRLITLEVKEENGEITINTIIDNSIWE